MTVHGAKGLEAPIVILIDGCEVHGPQPCLILVDCGRRRDVARLVAGQELTIAPRSLRRGRPCATRAREEHNRLLYVAMTRAGTASSSRPT